MGARKSFIASMIAVALCSVLVIACGGVCSTPLPSDTDLAEVTNLSVWSFGGGTYQGHVDIGWTLDPGYLPDKLEVSVFREGQNGCINKMWDDEPWSLPIQPGDTITKVLIYQPWPDDYRLLFHANYLCDGTRDFTYRFQVDADSLTYDVDRHVVFEAFTRSTCGNCQSARPAITQLASKYPDVAFIDYDVDKPVKSRYDRWWAAFGGNSAILPHIMVDSGYRISNGSVKFADVYKNMLDDALKRAPQADVIPYYTKEGDHAKFLIRIRNLGNVDLASTNAAQVHAVVYREVITTSSVEHPIAAVVSASIANLPQGSAQDFVLTTPSLLLPGETSVAWGDLRFLAIVDYRPGGTTGAYDAVQTAVACPYPYVIP